VFSILSFTSFLVFSKSLIFTLAESSAALAFSLTSLIFSEVAEIVLSADCTASSILDVALLLFYT
jgi:molybdopterin biosynthesis enzyme MoaB